MFRSLFYTSLLAGLLFAAFYLPKLVQDRKEFQPLSEKLSSAVARQAPAPEAPAASPPAEPEPEPEPQSAAQPPPSAPAPEQVDLSPFIAALAAGDLAKAAAMLDLIQPKIEPAKYAELKKSVDAAREREATAKMAATAPATPKQDPAAAATQAMVLESLKQLQQTQAETSKLLADLKNKPAATATPAPPPSAATKPSSEPAAPTASNAPLPGTVVIKFGNDSSVMDQAEADKLAPVLKVLAADSAVKVELRGFADKRGNAAYNLGLSNARALAVKDALRRAGVSDARMQVVPFGSFQATASATEGAEEYRKVEVLVLR